MAKFSADKSGVLERVYGKKGESEKVEEERKTNRV